MIFNRPLRLFSAVWGEHIAIFEDYCLRSLLWPENYAAVKTSPWTIRTRNADVDRMKALGERHGFQFAVSEIVENEHTGPMVGMALFEEMEACIAANAALLFVPPDTLFAEGSIPNMREIADPPYTCVAAGSVRVLPELIYEITGPTPPSPLVRMAWKHLHPTWIDAEIGRARANSWRGGVAWRKIRDGLYAVQHRIPSPWIVNPIPSDIEYLKAKGSVGAWDHEWPAKLVNEGRQRLIGSSDIAFMVEITPEDEAISPLADSNHDAPDAFHLDSPNNHVNRNTVALCRAC